MVLYDTKSASKWEESLGKDLYRGRVKMTRAKTENSFLPQIIPTDSNPMPMSVKRPAETEISFQKKMNACLSNTGVFWQYIS